MRSEGKLILCPTPIGNLGDITLRTLEALKSADVVCAEDTRVTGKLLAAYDIKKRLERLDEASISAKAGAIVARIEAGEIIAYCSDAGMPGVSDPGLRLVEAARAAQVAVEVLPGASAAATAYVASGCTNSKYYFGGFFPRKANEQRAALQEVAEIDAALVFYESPNRLCSMLSVVADVFPYREVSVCRELTKLHEEIARGLSADLRDEFAARAEQGALKGEIVVVIDGPSKKEREVGAAQASSDAQACAKELLEQGLSKKDVAKTLARDFGVSRNEAYELVLKA